MAITANILTTRTRFFTDVVSEFDGSGSTTDDPKGITSYAWTFGDGGTQSGTDTSGWHKYLVAGVNIAVTLTVTNSLLETDQTTLVISTESPIVDTSKQLRRYIAQFMNCFNGLTVLNKDNVPITVPLVWGNPDRVVAYIRGEINSSTEQKNAVALPILSARLTGLNPDYSRSKHNYHKTIAYDTALNQPQYLYAPTPVNMGFELGIWAMDYGQAFSLLETIVPWFNPALVLNIGDKDYSSMNDLELLDVSDQNVVDIGQDRRLVRYDINFELRGYLPQDRQVSDLVTKAFVNVTTDKEII